MSWLLMRRFLLWYVFNGLFRRGVGGADLFEWLKPGTLSKDGVEIQFAVS